jgi:hypothetical protein
MSASCSSVVQARGCNTPRSAVSTPNAVHSSRLGSAIAAKGSSPWWGSMSSTGEWNTTTSQIPAASHRADGPPTAGACCRWGTRRSAGTADESGPRGRVRGSAPTGSWSAGAAMVSPGAKRCAPEPHAEEVFFADFMGSSNLLVLNRFGRAGPRVRGSQSLVNSVKAGARSAAIRARKCVRLACRAHPQTASPKSPLTTRRKAGPA